MNASQDYYCPICPYRVGMQSTDRTVLISRVTGRETLTRADRSSRGKSVAVDVTIHAEAHEYLSVVASEYHLGIPDCVRVIVRDWCAIAGDVEFDETLFRRIIKRGRRSRSESEIRSCRFKVTLPNAAYAFLSRQANIVSCSDAEMLRAVIVQQLELKGWQGRY